MKEKRMAALLLAFILMIGLCACGDEKTPENAPAGVAVQVETVNKNDISTENKVVGRVTASSETSVFVSTAAKCTAVYVEAGDDVKKGDVICTLDLGATLASYSAAKISYRSAVDSYETQKELFDRQIALSEQNVENTKALFAIGAASQLEIDNAELTLLSAKAQRDATLAQLEAGIQNAKSGVEQLGLVMENIDDKGNVVAPEDGTLVSLTATEGGLVSSSYPVAVIDGTEAMKITASVAETLVPKLKIGDKAVIFVSAVDAEFEGTIRSVEKAANMQTRLYTVTLSVPAEVENLLSGMSADVTFHTNTSQDAVLVPTDAILTNNGNQCVYIVEDDTAKQVTIETGLVGNGVTEVTSGLVGGEQVVTVGQQYLSDGAAVRIVSAEG